MRKRNIAFFSAHRRNAMLCNGQPPKTGAGAQSAAQPPDSGFKPTHAGAGRSRFFRFRNFFLVSCCQALWAISACAEQESPTASRPQAPDASAASDSASDASGAAPDAPSCAGGSQAKTNGCVCGAQMLPPEEARFWQCVLPQNGEIFRPATENANRIDAEPRQTEQNAPGTGNDPSDAAGNDPGRNDPSDASGKNAPSDGDLRRYACYRAAGCYAGGKHYPQGTVYRDNAAWCGAHRHPGGNYACAWDENAQELVWICRGNCQCGDIQVQIADGRVVGGDLPFGYENFACDDAGGNAPAGYRAVTGHEYCADLPMMKGQTCRNQTIFCGAHSESMPYDSGYVCRDQKMICAEAQCMCGSREISFRAECRNRQPFCQSAPYPSFPGDGDYICSERGWMCVNPAGCKSPATQVSAFAVYKNDIPMCGSMPQYPHGADYICAEDTWICQNPKGCRFEKQPSSAPCFAARGARACADFRSMANTTQYKISYTPNFGALYADSDGDRLYSPEIDGVFQYICKTPTPCKCGKNACGQGFSCASGACLCLDINVAQSQSDQCMTHGDAGIILRDAVPCGGTPQCRGACIGGKCMPAKGLFVHLTPIEHRRDLLETSSLCIDKSGCSLADGRYLEFGQSLSPIRDQDLWLFYAKRYGWKSCLDDALETDIFDIRGNLRAIAQTPALYQCRIDPDAEERRIFACKADICSCNGEICHNGDICSPEAGCVTPRGEKRKPPMCAGHALMYGQTCIDGNVFCIDPASPDPIPAPKSWDPEAKKPTFRCTSLAHGKRGWFASSPDAQCGSKAYGADYECIGETPKCGGAPYPGPGYACKSGGDADRNPLWVCSSPGGCACGSSKTCPQSAACQNDQCICGGISLGDAAQWQCEDGKWTCAQDRGCRADRLICPVGAEFGDNSCICAGMPMPQNARCQSDRWICGDGGGCDCNGITIPNGDYCAPARFSAADKTIPAKDYQKNAKRFMCGSRQCPAYTACYNGQCLFQAAQQRLKTPSEYKSVRGYPRCAKRSGCECADNACKLGEYCVDNQCAKSPIYGLCRGVRVPVVQINARQRRRAISHADDTAIVWKSLFERIPEIAGAAATALQTATPDDRTPSDAPDFFQTYSDPNNFDLACLTMPDPTDIEDYAYWVATSESLDWDAPDEPVPQELAEFDEKSPFVYSNDPELRKKSDDYIRFMDEYSSLQTIALSTEPIGWVCAKNTCKCGGITCRKDEKCAISDGKHICSAAVFSPVLDENSFLQTTPFKTPDAPAPGDAIDIESENMADKPYRRYVLCNDEKGCPCGSQTCLKYAACVDDRMCLNDCPDLPPALAQNANPPQCIIPYRRRNCPGADGVDGEGNCRFMQKTWPPNVYVFHHALGAQCAAQTCPCGSAACSRDQWCSLQETCIDGN